MEAAWVMTSRTESGGFCSSLRSLARPSMSPTKNCIWNEEVGGSVDFCDVTPVTPWLSGMQ